MAETVFPGTTRRFSPTILLTGQGGTTPSGWNSIWNQWVEPYYNDWIDPTEGVKMGLYHPAYALKNFYVGSVVPSNPSNPNDPAYDWSHFDAQLGSSPIAQGKAKFHFMLDVEGSTIPAWMAAAGYVHQASPEQKEVIDFSNAGLVSAMQGFWSAFAARYNDDIRVYTILIDEDNSKGGVDENAFQNGKITVYTHCSTVCSKIQVIVTMNPVIIEDLCVDTQIGPGQSDIKMFGFDCGPTNFPPPGGYSCTLETHRACERHNSVLSSPPRAARPVCLLSISNGYRIIGGADGYSPPSLTNPWGELLPTPLEPPANSDTNVTPAIYAWYISGEPRGSNKDSGLGQAGNDPIGIIPSNYFCITTTGLRHANETPADWDRALSIFGASGTKAVPAIPVGFDPTGVGGGGSATSTASEIWSPSVNDSWFIQLDITAGLDTGVDVDIYDIDIFDNSAGVVSSLKAQGKRVVGYFSAGSYENWRPDEGDFPSAVLGNALDDWPGERWLDVRNISALRPIMQARMDIAVTKGFDAVDPDNVDGFENNTGFPITAGHQIAYNQMLAEEAHQRGLSCGLKNDPNQVSTLVSSHDFSINEEAFFYNEELSYVPFITAGKAVFNIEYQEKKCDEAAALGFYHVFKNLSLDAYRDGCEGGVVNPPSGQIRLDAITTNGSNPVSTAVHHQVGAGTNKLMVVGVAIESLNPSVTVLLDNEEMSLVAAASNSFNYAAIYNAWDASITYGERLVSIISSDTIPGTHITVSTWFDIKQNYIRSTASAVAQTTEAVSFLINTLDRGIGGLGFHVAAHERAGRVVSFPDGQNAILNVPVDNHTSNSCWELYVTGGVNTITTQCTGSADSMVFVSAAFDPDPVAEATATFLRQTLDITGNVFTTNATKTAPFLTGSYPPNGRLFFSNADTADTAQIITGDYPISSDLWLIGSKIVVEFIASSIPISGGVFNSYDDAQIARPSTKSIGFRGNKFTVQSKGGWATLGDSDNQWVKLQDR